MLAWEGGGVRADCLLSSPSVPSGAAALRLAAAPGRRRRRLFFRARTSHQHLFRVIDRIPTDDTTRTPSCLLSIARGAFNTFSERRRGIESERGTRIATRERLHHSRRERSVTLVRLLVPGPSAYDSARSASLASESAPSVASTSVGVSSSASVATSPERPALAI